MHNLIFQFLTEFGLFAIVCYVFIFAWVIKCVKNIEKDNINIMRVAFAVSFVLISSQSSVGILSNYYMWMVVFYIALAYKEENEDTKYLDAASIRGMRGKNRKTNVKISQ